MSTLPSLNRFRLDVEGLRAIAILLVLANHFFGNYCKGGFIGVDIFFVISGFIIVSTILNEIEHTGHFSVRKFYGRRIRRIIPAATVVLIVSSFIVYFIFPVSERATFGYDIVSAALWFVNFVLAARQVNYLAEGIGQSPLQHFWSLSVEEQFYFITPVILIILYFALKGGHKSLNYKRFNYFLYWYLCILVIIVICSLTLAINFTAFSPGASYFVSPTRFWELAIGCIVAVLYYCFVLTNLPRIITNIMSILGFSGLVMSILLISPDTNYPSYMTILPVMSTALIIAAGCANKTPMLNKFISVKPLVKLGGISYEIYLWHWVVLISLREVWQQGEGLTFEQSLRCIALSVVFALITKALVSDPIRFSRTIRSSKRLTYSIGLFCVVCAVIAGACLIINYNLTIAKFSSSDSYVTIDGKLQESEMQKSYSTITPNPLTASDDIPASYDDGCAQSQNALDTDVLICLRGDINSDRLIISAGDSKMQQWESALDDFGKLYGYRVELLVKSNCVWMDAILYDESQPNKRNDGCLKWSNNVLDYTIDMHPDLFISSQHAFSALNNPDDKSSTATSSFAAQKGLLSYWQKLDDNQIKIGVVLNNPTIEDGWKNKVSRAFDCVADNITNLSKCHYFPDNHVAIEQEDAVNMFSGNGKISIINMNPYICLSSSMSSEQGICPAVIGDTSDAGVLVYRQGSHLTNTFVKKVSSLFSKELAAIMNISDQLDTGGNN